MLRRSFQLTRPVRGEPDQVWLDGRVKKISTHSPRAGRTVADCGVATAIGRFQLTRPVRGEPGRVVVTQCSVLFQLTRPVRGEPRMAKG